MANHLWSFAFLTVAFVVCGCSRSPARPETVPLSGTVTYQGKPVDGAEVSLTPEAGGADVHPARGMTDAQGAFRVKTYFAPNDEPDGALPGDYTVTIRKIDLPQGIVSPENYTPPKNHLPAKYDNPKESGLSAQVKAGQTPKLTFELKD